MVRAMRILEKIRISVKTNYRCIFFAVLVILLIFIVYGDDLKILFNEAVQTEAFSHILLVPFFAIFLFYLKKDLIKASISLEKIRKQSATKYLNELAGVILCLIAFLVYWYGSHTFYPLEYHLMSLPIFLMGIVLVLSNSKVLITLILPIVFLFFLVPPPMEFMYAVGGSMANFETQISYILLRSFGIPVKLSYSYGPPIIQLLSDSNSVSFAVDLPCSGMYSLIAFTMFSAFLAFISKASIKRKILMFIGGFFVFEALNIVRITSIVLIGHYFGEEIAMFVFHSIAGIVLIFIGMFFTLIFADRVLKIKFFTKPREIKFCRQCKRSLKEKASFCLRCGNFLNQSNWQISFKTWAKVLVLLVGCWLVTISLNAPTFAMAGESIKVSSGTSWTNTTEILPEIQDYQLKFLYRDVNYEKIAHQDAALVYAYFPINYSKPTVYVSINVANSISNLHSWEVCLITWQMAHGRYPLVKVLDSREIDLLEGTSIIARYLAFKAPQNYTQITLYWFERATFDTGVSVGQKYVRISLIILTYESTNYREFEDELLSMGKTIASYWEPLKFQSLISLGIPALQFLLVISTVLIIVTKIGQYSYELRKRMRNLKIFRGFASKNDKLVLQTVIDLAKEKRYVGTMEIMNAFREKTGKSIENDELIDILNRLEEYGFIRKDVVSVDNVPKLVWKVYELGI